MLPSHSPADHLVQITVKELGRTVLAVVPLAHTVELYPSNGTRTSCRTEGNTEKLKSSCEKNFFIMSI